MTEAAKPLVSVFCVDDVEIICSALSEVLNATPPFHCVGVALSPDEAFTQMTTIRPDLAVIDLLYIQGSGFLLLDQLRIHLPETRAVVYSALDDATCARRCLQRGARGYVSKYEGVDALVHVLREVAEGKTCVSPLIEDQILRDYTQASDGLGDGIARLSAIELSIFLMLGQAMNTHDIARRLCKSPKTIEAHMRQVRQKMGLTNGSALLQTAARYLARVG